ncbi:MAG: type II toxin-antitoxin system VapC family toxin [Microbacteriaceae bacterium]
MTREAIVVDASVIVSLLIDPAPLGDALGARMADASLLAPTLLPFEVTNVLRRRRNAGLLSPAEAALARDGFAELPIDLWPWEPLASRVWQLGDNLRSYDAAYVALAEQTGCVLLTRDARIAGAPGVACKIELV